MTVIYLADAMNLL